MMENLTGHEYAMGLSIFWWILGILIAGGFIWLMITTLKQKSNGYPLPGDKSPLDKLKDRYARGEIDKEEFDKRKKDLVSTG